MACGGLQLFAGLEASIEGSNHAVDQWWRERTALAPEDRVEEESEDGITSALDDVDRGRDTAAVVGVEEVGVRGRGE